MATKWLVAIEHDVVDEHDTRLPVVKGHELTDHRDDRVGQSPVIGRARPEPFDLAHDVIAEIAPESTGQWG